MASACLICAQAMRRIVLMLALLLCSATSATAQAFAREVPLEASGGTFLVPVLINDTITLKFTLDSGASDVTIPEDVFLTLVRAETITAADLRAPRRYSLADGSTVTHPTFIIRSLKVGDLQLVNVFGSVSGRSGSLLLGQSFLSRLSTWSIDNRRGVLVFNTEVTVREPPRSYTPAPVAAYGGPVTDGVACADGHVQSLTSGPPFCQGRGGIAGYREGPSIPRSTAASGGGNIICQDGALQSLASGPPYCTGRGGIGGFR